LYLFGIGAKRGNYNGLSNSGCKWGGFGLKVKKHSQNQPNFFLCLGQVNLQDLNFASQTQAHFGTFWDILGLGWVRLIGASNFWTFLGFRHVIWQTGHGPITNQAAQTQPHQCFSQVGLGLG
jgi:hypothetical protein